MSPDPIKISDDRSTPSSAGGERTARLSGVLGLINVDRAMVAGLCAASVGFFAAAYAISVRDPDYFDRRLLSTMRQTEIDPITTGTVAGGTPQGGEPIPVPRVVRAKPPVPGDYQIVMVFGSEAILATEAELWRVKVGSIVPGLGEVLEIDPTETGGTVRASEATLRSVAR